MKNELPGRTTASLAVPDVEAGTFDFRCNFCCLTDKKGLGRRLPYQERNDRRVDASSNPSQNWSSWLEAQAGRYLLFARTQVRSEADAQDLLQEVLVEVWRRAAGHPPDDALGFKTLRRRAGDLGRRTDRRERREQATLDWWQAPAGSPHSENLGRLDLPADCRDARPAASHGGFALPLRD